MNILLTRCTTSFTAVGCLSKDCLNSVILVAVSLKSPVLAVTLLSVKLYFVTNNP